MSRPISTLRNGGFVRYALLGDRPTPERWLSAILASAGQVGNAMFSTPAALRHYNLVSSSLIALLRSIPGCYASDREMGKTQQSPLEH
jgi:hypothetical protein